MSSESIVPHIPALRRYARALTGDVWSADDLVQDTLERACSRWKLWLAGSNLRPWLFTVMHNLFMSQVRQEHRRSQLAPLVDIDDVAFELHAPPSNIGTALDIQRCLLRLPLEQRAVLLLVVMEDLTYSEVAKVTGTPIGTVMSRLARARERMRELLEAPHASVKTQPSLKRMK